MVAPTLLWHVARDGSGTSNLNSTERVYIPSTQSGDLLIIVWATNDDGHTMSTPSGLTRYYSNYNLTVIGYTLNFYYRIANGNEPAYYDFIVSGAGPTKEAFVSAYHIRGADSASAPFDSALRVNSAFGSFGTTQNIDTLSVSVGGSDRMVLLGAFTEAIYLSSWGIPSGYMRVFATSIGASSSQAVYRTRNGGTEQVQSLGSSRGFVSWGIAIKPRPSVSPYKAVHTQVASQPSLSVEYDVPGFESVHTHVADAPSLVHILPTFTISARSAHHTHAAQATSIVHFPPKFYLPLSSAFHTHAADTPAMLGIPPEFDLTVDDSALAHVASSASMQDLVLVDPQPGFVAHVADACSLSGLYDLTPAAAVHPDLADAGIFEKVIAPAKIVHVHAGESVGITAIGSSDLRLDPVVDIEKGGWTPDTGTDLYARIAQYSGLIASPEQPTGEICEVRLTAASDPLTHADHRIVFTARAEGEVTVTITLLQGTTVIDSWTETLSANDQTFSYTLSTAGAGQIANYSDLRLRLSAQEIVG